MNGFKSYDLPILIYDSECPLCLRFKQSLDRIDTENTVNKVPLQDENVFKAYPELDPKLCSQAVHLIDENGKLHIGPQVPKYLIQTFPAIKKFAWLADTKVGEKAIGLFYNTLSRYRESLLNRCPKCKKHHREKSL